MINYVVGFAFYNDEVLLIRKNRPKNQAGLLNGIGGKIEEFDDTPADAMAREFREECGLETIGEEWFHVCTIGDIDQKYWNVVVYATRFDSINGYSSLTDEEVDLFKIKDIMNRKEACMSNLPWLIGMALDEQHPAPSFIGYK